MADPIYELQAGIVARLKSDATVTALIGQRVYDFVPADGSGQPMAQFPYISMGPASAMEDDADCIDAVDVMFRVEVWSRAVGYGEVMDIAGAVRKSLHRYDMTFATNALVEIEHRRTDRMRDPDGLTSRAVLEFGAIIETP